MRMIPAIILASALAGACATTKTWEAVGGSRADGVVRLAFDYGLFQSPRIDEAQALDTARARCRVWGYTDAEAFGGALQQCNSTNAYGNCISTTVTKEYQCTGAGQPQ